MSSIRGSAGAGSSISDTITRSCWRSSGSGGKNPGTRIDLTNSPTICAFGSIVRLPIRMRWPSRKRSASSSLIAVWVMSSAGCALIEILLSGEPHIGQGEALAKRIGRIGAVLEHAGDPRLAGDRGDDARSSAHRDLGGDRRVEPRADDRLVNESLPRAELTAGVQDGQTRRGARAAGAPIDAARRDDHGIAAHGVRARERHGELGERHPLDVRVLRVARRQLLLGRGDNSVAQGDEVARLFRLDREAERRRVDDREEGPAVRDVDGDLAYQAAEKANHNGTVVLHATRPR